MSTNATTTSGSSTEIMQAALNTADFWDEVNDVLSTEGALRGMPDMVLDRAFDLARDDETQDAGHHVGIMSAEEYLGAVVGEACARFGWQPVGSAQ